MNGIFYALGTGALVLVNVGSFALNADVIRGYKSLYGQSARQHFQELKELRKTRTPAVYYLTYPATKLAERIYF